MKDKQVYIEVLVVAPPRTAVVVKLGDRFILLGPKGARAMSEMLSKAAEQVDLLGGACEEVLEVEEVQHVTQHS